MADISFRGRDIEVGGRANRPPYSTSGIRDRHALPSRSDRQSRWVRRMPLAERFVVFVDDEGALRSDWISADRSGCPATSSRRADRTRIRQSVVGVKAFCGVILAWTRSTLTPTDWATSKALSMKCFRSAAPRPCPLCLESTAIRASGLQASLQVGSAAWTSVWTIGVSKLSPTRRRQRLHVSRFRRRPTCDYCRSPGSCGHGGSTTD